jgi:MFS family permease
MYTFLFSVLPQEIAWRTMFWIGLLPAVLVFYVRRFIDEPAVFRDAAAGGGSPFSIVRRDLLGIGLQGGNCAFIVWLPTFLKTTRGLTLLGTGTYTIVFMTGAFCGFISAAHFSDRFGRRWVFTLFSACAAALFFVYTALPIGNELMCTVRRHRFT